MAGEARDSGLRERKKRRTRDEIARAALELFDRQGYQETTIAQIAAAADVSPRTVSSYFPAKEELVFATLGPLEQRLRDSLDRRPAGQDTMEALRLWLIDERRGWEGREEELACHNRMVESDEHLSSMHRARIHRLELLIAESIARDLDLPPDHVEPRMAAAAAAAVFDLLEAERPEGAKFSPTGMDHQLDLIDQALTFVSGGIQALRSGRGKHRAEPADRPPAG